MRIIEIVATRCQILRLKCIEFDFSWCSAPDPAVGAYSLPPDSIAAFKGPTSRRREGGKGKDRGGEGRKGRERDRRFSPAFLISHGCRGLEYCVAGGVLNMWIRATNLRKS